MEQNVLSIREFMNHKTDKKVCREIADALCAATARAWANAKFEAISVPSIVASQNRDVISHNINCKGLQISFQLVSEDLGAKEVGTKGTIEHITQGGKYEQINIPEIHTFVTLNNQDWNVIAKYYMKDLGEYLDIKHVALLNAYEEIPHISEYAAPSALQDVKRDGTTYSNLFMPTANSGQQPSISASLIFASYKDLRKYAEDRKALAKEIEEDNN